MAVCAHFSIFLASSSHTLEAGSEDAWHRASLPGPTEMVTVWQLICQAVLTTGKWDKQMWRAAGGFLGGGTCHGLRELVLGDGRRGSESQSWPTSSPDSRLPVRRQAGCPPSSCDSLLQVTPRWGNLQIPLMGLEISRAPCGMGFLQLCAVAPCGVGTGVRDRSPELGTGPWTVGRRDCRSQPITGTY